VVLFEVAVAAAPGGAALEVVGELDRLESAPVPAGLEGVEVAGDGVGVGLAVVLDVDGDHVVLGVLEGVEQGPLVVCQVGDDGALGDAVAGDEAGVGEALDLDNAPALGRGGPELGYSVK
jgi:hypothetical protein